MSQTGAIFIACFVAFVVFVTMRGDLGKWLGLLLPAGTPPPAGSQVMTTTPDGRKKPINPGDDGGPYNPKYPAFPSLPNVSGVGAG